MNALSLFGRNLITIQEFAEAEGTHYTTVYRWTNQGMPYKQVPGKGRMINPVTAKKWLEWKDGNRGHLQDVITALQTRCKKHKLPMVLVGLLLLSWLAIAIIIMFYTVPAQLEAQEQRPIIAVQEELIQVQQDKIIEILDLYAFFLPGSDPEDLIEQMHSAAPMAAEPDQEFLQQMRVVAAQASAAVETAEVWMAELAATPAGNPLEGKPRLISGHGMRRDPFDNTAWEFHRGVDLRASSGDPVLVTAAGRVSYVGFLGNYGLLIKVDHGFGFETRYAHLSGVDVRVGETVQRGDVIAYVGSTGRSKGPHLHYEVVRRGVAVNTIPYLTGGK